MSAQHAVPAPLQAATTYELRTRGSQATWNPVVVPAYGHQARPVRLGTLAGASSREIRGIVQQVLALFLVDDSGSMYGQWGDPTGVRYAAALSLVALMRKSGGGRAGVLHWGTAPGGELTCLDVRKHPRALTQALQIPPTLGGNDLPAALQRGRELLGASTPEQHPLVFVLTDGIEDVTPATVAAVAALPARSVHMVLIDRSNGCTSDMEAAWRSVAFGSFTRLTRLNVQDMASEMGDVFANALGLTVTPTLKP